MKLGSMVQFNAGEHILSGTVIEINSYSDGSFSFVIQVSENTPSKKGDSIDRYGRMIYKLNNIYDKITASDIIQVWPDSMDMNKEKIKRKMNNLFKIHLIMMKKLFKPLDLIPAKLQYRGATTYVDTKVVAENSRRILTNALHGHFKSNIKKNDSK